MKTSEFIKQVEELGYETDKNNWYIYIQYKRSTVAIVSLIRVNTMDTLYGDASNDLDLFNLIVEYAKTPLEDREDEKKFTVRCRVTQQCLQTNKFGYHVWTSENNAHEYTLKELESLGINPEHYDLEECVELAYDEIKDRKGKLINGVFVKEEDL